MGSAATFDWTTGDFAAANVPNPLLSGNILNIDTGGGKRFFGGSFANSGLVQWRADSVQAVNGAALTNAGVWEALGDDFLTASGSPTPTFINSGTLRKKGGAGATTFGNFLFSNDAGTIDAQTGTILFSGGTSTFNDGSKFQGAGSVQIAGNAGFGGSLLSDNLVLASGLFTGTNARLAGGIAAAGRIVWEAGDLAGTWEVGAGSTLEASGTGAKRQTGGSLVNRGTVLWNAMAAFQGGNGAQFVNHGLFDARVETAVSTFTPGSRNTFVNQASGVVRASSGVTLTIGNAALVGEGGEFNAAAGASIVYVGGSAQFNDGTRFTGAGTHVFNSDARFTGAFQTANVSFSGGTQSGGDGVNAGSKAILQGPLSWTGGILQGAWEIQSGSVLNVVGTGAKQQAGGSIVNNGSVIWDSAVAFQGRDAAALVNNGLFEARTSVSVNFQGAGARNTFTNTASGTVRAANGATLMFDGVALTSNGGLFEASAASAIVYTGGNVQFNDGTRFAGAGTHTVADVARFVGAFQSSNLAFAAGGIRFGGDGTTAGSKAIAQGALEWRGGELQGDWEIAPGATLTATGANAKTQRGGNIVNKGAVAWDSDASFQSANGARVVNDGVFDVSTDADLAHATGMPGTFVNNGRFVKSGGDGETSLTGVNFEGAGTIDVRSGTVVLPNAFRNAGLLTGTGTFALAGTLENNGHVAPGASPGTLTIDGHFRQVSGVLDIEVNSVSVFDRIVVTGNVDLGGTLALHCFADCRVAAGETLDIVFASGQIRGQFDAITLTGFGAGRVLPLDPAGGVFSLQVMEALAPVPEPETYALMLSGLGIVVWAARRKRRSIAAAS